MEGVCKLCQREAELRRGHLIPAGVYRRTRVEDSDKPNPVTLTENGMCSTSDQATAHILCTECEGRFDRGGEEYVMRLISTQTSFPLLDQLKEIKPRLEAGQWSAYSMTDVPQLDVQRVIYFAMSIFWRGAIHRWTTRDGHSVKLDFGQLYSERLRRYLLNESGFPDNATLWVLVFREELSRDVTAMPHFTGRTGAAWGY